MMNAWTSPYRKAEKIVQQFERDIDGGSRDWRSALRLLRKRILTALGEEGSRRVHNDPKIKTAYWTYDAGAYVESGEHLYYFAPTTRTSGPYTTQRTVTAIIDIAEDGTLAGVELIEGMPPPPNMEATASPGTTFSEAKL